MTKRPEIEPGETPAAAHSHTSKVSYDPRVSLNTIIMCLTVIGVSWGLIDKISSNAATTATMQAELRMNTASITQIQQQRVFDRQELLLELRDIKTEIAKTKK